MITDNEYNSLLRSMSALSQQFTRRRPAATPPNPTLNWRRFPSFKVTKSRSNQSSPMAAHPRRSAQASMTDQAYFSQGLHFAGSSDLDRPRSWHANVDPASVDYHPPEAVVLNNLRVNAYLQHNEQAQLSAHSYAASWQTGAWEQSRLPDSYQSFFPAGYQHDGQFNYHFGTQPDNNFSSEAFNTNGGGWAPLAAAEPSGTDCGGGLGLSPDGDERELVGVGLYDKATSQIDGGPSMLLGMGLDDEQAAGKGLQLEETWAPPADQVPEAEADEGSDTPVTADFQAWAPFEHDSSFCNDEDNAHWPGYEDLAVPQIRQADVYAPNFFYGSCDDGSAIPDDVLAAQHKAAPMSWGSSDWLSAHGGFSNF